MKKLKLQLDELQVESFQTARAEAPGGTVRGNAPTWFCTEQIDCTWDYGCETEAASCNGSCQSCADTCGVSCYGSCNATCASCDYSCYESGCACSVQWSACGVYACP
jgi:hypothetical protein